MKKEIKESEETVHAFIYNGVECSFSTGKFARRSNSAVMARMGDTVILVNVDLGDPVEGLDFFPLQVEYIERMYAGGLISSSRFIKRERFPSDEATLIARMLDRSIRSRFPSDYRNQLQVVVTILSYDPAYDPAIISFSAVSAALMASTAIFEGPIAGVRVGYDGTDVNLLMRPIDSEDVEEKTRMNFVLATDGEMVTMIDADGKEVPEDIVIKGMEFGIAASKEFIDAQNEFIEKIEAERGKIVKPEYQSFALSKDVLGEVRKAKKSEIEDVLKNGDRNEKEEALTAIKADLFSEYEGKYSKSSLSEAVDYVTKELVRSSILKDRTRVDGRALDEVRPLSMEVGVLPRAHGSGLFSRGETQALTVTTLGSGRLEQITEGMDGEGTRRYMHHYNAPDYTIGIAGKYRYIPKRREIGHGALAEKALIPVLPSQDVFPYTIRVVSEVLAQSGSSSMASTCGSTLSLMDAGVPIIRPVAGIAIGVVMSDDLKDFAVLTDIADLADFYGDLDFKVTGTSEGVTAVQMDNKKSGLPMEVFKEAIEAAKKARLFILDEMKNAIAEPRVHLSKYAPKIDILKIPVAKIGELIGPGGKVIKGIIERTGADIDVKDDGTVSVSSINEESRKQAVEFIESMFEEPEIGRVYDGKVAKIAEFGAFVDVGPSMTGLVHVSEMSNSFVKDPRDIVKEGQMVKVKVIGVDERGRVKMSMKQVDGGAGASGASEKTATFKDPEREDTHGQRKQEQK